MILLVNQNNHAANQAILTEMHCQRRAVFVDRLKWALAVTDGLEIDIYDRPDSIYLLSLDTRTGTLLASLRLLPTTQNHLMSSLFSHLCPDKVPRGADIWEASRFCVNPAITSQAEKHNQLWRLIAGIMETSLLFGVNQVTFVAARALLPLTLKAGWQVSPLGNAQHHGKDKITAVIADITPEGLKTVRKCHDISGPLIRFSLPPEVPASVAA